MNKKGWTLVGELVVFLIAIIFLIYSIYGLYRLGLVYNLEKAIPIVKPQLLLNGNVTNYDDVEKEIISASKSYVHDKHNDNFVGEKIIIRLKHLQEEGYIGTIRDNMNRKCSGYVRVSKYDGNLVYEPYLKCRKYATDGYESEYDW